LFWGYGVADELADIVERLETLAGMSIPPRNWQDICRRVAVKLDNVRKELEEQ